MKYKYLLFAGYGYYPNGGWDDLKSKSNDIGFLRGYWKKIQKEHGFDWAEIVDITELKVVWRYKEGE